MQLQDATSESSTACDNEVYGPFSDGEADKCYYNGGRNRNTRSRSLPRRPASSMMNTINNNVPHYVTLSRSAMIGTENSAILFESARYSSQPQLNREAILDFSTALPKYNARSTSLKKSKKVMPPPKYVQPVSQQESLENSDYLFPDLPPPPDALLDNTTTSASPPSLQQNSRCSSLDDLNWVTSAAEMTRSLGKSNTLPTKGHNQPISIMKKRASNPIELQRRSSGAVKVDLSSADKTIRRPGSEPDLKTSPMRSSMRSTTPNEKRLSGLSTGSSKKVMFSGLASDEEENSIKDQEAVWVLRHHGGQMEAVQGAAAVLVEDDDVPVTGVVIAQPQPCKFALQQQFLQQQISPAKKLKPAPPPPPPRTTPMQQPVANGGVPRAANPVLQRPAQQQFHESPDEGYHEDDNGSEVL